MATENVNMNEVTRFIVKMIYNRPGKELSPGESRYNMLLKRKASSKTFPSSEALLPDQKSLDIKGHKFFFMNFCPGTMTTHAESINSDLQRGLDRRLQHTQH